MLPLVAPDAGFIVVPLTITVTLAQGSGGGSFLPQETPSKITAPKARIDGMLRIDMICRLKI
jgi:hypothetical protein